MTDKEHIKAVISKTFLVIKKVYENQKEGINKPIESAGSRLIFPQTNKEETRVSEQELRFIFVEQLNQYLQSPEGQKWNVYYSVETPTKRAYYFKDNSPRCDEKKGQSGRIDLVIHNSDLQRVALIEFKANNPEIHDYQKDLVKLTNDAEDGEYRYFIQLLENTKKGKDFQTDTYLNIMEKISPSHSKDEWTRQWGKHKVIVHCVSLEKRSNQKVLIDFEEYSKEFIS